MKFPHLAKTSLWAALSKLGQHIQTPKGIFYWSSRAKKEAQIDGTIGIAQDDDGTISHLKITEPWVGQKVMERAAKGKIFGYAPIEGLQTLREKWLARMLKNHPELAGYATLPVVTNGITHSLALAGRLLLTSRDVLITADKSWENYEHIFTGVQGIKIIEYPLFTGDGRLHLDALIGTAREAAAHHKKVTILLNFPHNQTGYMPSTQECDALGSRLHELVKSKPQTQFVVILDDAYEGYSYDDRGQKISPLSQIFGKFPNLTVVKLDGISKVMLAYGYRIGFITFFINSLDSAPFSEEFLMGLRAEVGTKIGGFVRGEISQVNHHGQVLADALLEKMDEVDKERAQVIEMLTQRWQAMITALEAGFKKYGKKKMWADPCNGGFFGYVNLSKELDPKVVAERLLTSKKVGVVPGPAGLRIAFAGVTKEKVTKLIEAVFEVVYS